MKKDFGRGGGGGDHMHIDSRVISRESRHPLRDVS